MLRVNHVRQRRVCRRPAPSPSRERTDSGPVRRYRWAEDLGGGGVHEAALGGYPRGLRAVVGVELGEDRADVELDGPLGDKEAFGDGRVLEAPGEQRQHLELAGGQGVRLPRVLADASQQAVRDGGTEQGTPGVNRADGGEDVGAGGALEQ